MRRLIIPFVCLSLMGFFSLAHGASATDLLIKDGKTVNMLEDNDWESLKGDTDTQLEVGEFLYGLLEIQQVQDARNNAIFNDPTFHTFTGVFALKVDKITSVGSQFRYDFVPLTHAEWATIYGFATNPLVRQSASSFALIYSDARALLTDSFVDVVPTIEASLKSAYLNTTAPLWEFGLAGDSGEFWFAMATSTNIADPLLGVQTFVALNTTHTYPLGLPLLKHGELYGDLTSPNLKISLGSFTHVQAFGNLGSGTKGVWQLRTDTDYYIKPTPEPGSLALLGLGLAAFGGYAWRRHRRS